jgi:hypothetical protein
VKTESARFEGSYTRPMLEGRQSDTSSYSLLHMYATFLSLVPVSPSSLELIALWRLRLINEAQRRNDVDG